MTEKDKGYKQFDSLHAATKLKHLTKILLTQPKNMHDQISTRLNSMFDHPAHKNNLGIELLDLISDDERVMLKYVEFSEAEGELRKHKFAVSSLGDQSYSRSIVDCHGGHIRHAIDLHSGLEIVNHPEAVRQITLITPLIMASTVAILGSTYVHQVTEMGRILQR